MNNFFLKPTQFWLFFLLNFSVYSQTEVVSGYIDMHYSILKGNGYLQKEKGGTLVFDILKDVNASENQITVGNTVDLLPNQLIVYFGDNLKYNINVILNISGNIVTLKNNLGCNVKKGANFFNFYYNNYHPNKYGYYAIADNLVGKNLITGELEYETQYPSYRGNIRITENYSNDYSNCGSLNCSALDVIGNSSSQYLEYFLIKRAKEEYIIRVVANTYGEDVSIVIDNGKFSTEKIINSNSPKEFNLKIDLKKIEDNEIRLKIYSKNSNQKFNILKKIKLIRRKKRELNFNNKNVLLFGDSWFFQDDGGYIKKRLKELFPSARFINSGIGGNTTENLIQRFEKDVILNKPDAVVILSDTNDYYSKFNPDNYNNNIQLLKKKCFLINANPLFITNSVGSSDVEDEFDLSRIYANETNWLSILNYKIILKEKIIIPNIIVDPNELKKIMVLGKMENSISISDYYFTHTVEFNISTSINGNITPVLSLPGNTYS
ncbi:hypothetical protein V6246_10290 [Algibacter sp. TI.3.09]|uniref:SGNH/GDSL hydrolase family protein n=1 Tax=Algibacter sp. TI.3.09 TaxID=3121298 RepID=UPI00311F8DDF